MTVLPDLDPYADFGDVHVSLTDDYVAIVEICRPPNNFFDLRLVDCIADAYEALDDDKRCRAIILRAQGKHFCAGANYAVSAEKPTGDPSRPDRHLYDAAIRLFKTRKPVVAAVQGAAIGGGLGLALSADFRITVPQARLSANFARLGSHHGFGLTALLPRLVGQQRALELLLTGSRLNGEQATSIGLCDRLSTEATLLEEAYSMASAIAQSAPMAVEAIRLTMRDGFADQVEAAMRTERIEQDRLLDTADRAEGLRASAERRTPRFIAE